MTRLGRVAGPGGLQGTSRQGAWHSFSAPPSDLTRSDEEVRTGPDLHHELSRVIERIPSESLFFLDSTNLLDLRNINLHIHGSANYVLLLSRDTLTRPVVLVELCAAYISGTPICTVLIDYPTGDKRAFSFPADLEAAITGLETYIHTEHQVYEATPARAKLGVGGGGEGTGGARPHAGEVRRGDVAWGHGVGIPRGKADVGAVNTHSAGHALVARQA